MASLGPPDAPQLARFWGFAAKLMQDRSGVGVCLADPSGRDVVLGQHRQPPPPLGCSSRAGERQLEAACLLTPGFESPTVSPLADSDWVAVRAMVERVRAQRTMDELWDVGARAILVTDIHACRL